MEGPVEDKKAVEVGEEGPLGLKEGVEVGDETAANLFSKWNSKENQQMSG